MKYRQADAAKVTKMFQLQHQQTIYLPTDLGLLLLGSTAMTFNEGPPRSELRHGLLTAAVLQIQWDSDLTEEKKLLPAA